MSNTITPVSFNYKRLIYEEYTTERYGDLLDYEKDLLLGILTEGKNNISGKDAEDQKYHYTGLGKEKFDEAV